VRVTAIAHAEVRMTYQALARKWRPKRFAELVGQEHVQRALINALDTKRLHHAFLFTGTRGVGKTTIARILAKSLNCEKGVSSQPCGVCSACTEIDEGRFVDLLEIDAASHTGVDDVREMIENAQYRPARGAYKVYLIDEVHMLSKPAFNALLKTLEEPPEHAKFLLATTDPQKLPVTVLSRCLQFGLKRLPQPAIVAYLRKVLATEQVTSDADALEAIARAADGSMRDALSLLDQAIAHGGGKLTGAEVRAMLGTVDRRRIHELLGLLAAADAPGLLATVAALDELAPDYEGVLAELASALQRLAIMQAVPAAASEWDDRAVLAPVAAKLDPAEVQLLYQIAITSRRDLPLAADPRTGFEMALLRMLAFRPGAEGASPRVGSGPGAAADAAPVARSAPATAPPPPSVTDVAATAEWSELVERMALKGLVRELAVNCALKLREGQRFELALAPAHRQLLSDRSVERIQEALGRVLGRAATLRIELGAVGGETPAAAAARGAAERTAQARDELSQDPVVRAMGDAFGAQLLPDSVRPND
jgi:DNA polymerase-3 subunit gamma/tau